MSHEHFKGKYEVELKYRISSKESFLQVLSSMDYQVMLEDNLEADCYFDDKERSLFKLNKSVCIRAMEPSGIKLWIVKGPEADCCEATNITDVDKAKSMLKTMGYEVVLEMSKHRSIYFVGAFHITIDYLDGLGDFAEFAIMTDEENELENYRIELTDLASQFGLSSDDIELKSYRTLYTELTHL